MSNRQSGLRLAWLAAGFLVLATLALCGKALSANEALASTGSAAIQTQHLSNASGERVSSLAATNAYTAYLPLAYKPFGTLKSLVISTTITLPQPLGPAEDNWCTWNGCSISPRLYHEPLNDGRTLLGWTDASGNGHVSSISAAGNITQTLNFPGQSVRGLTAHADSSFALLLWNAVANSMSLAKRAASGDAAWTINVNSSIAHHDPGIGDSRLTYGNGLYAAYFAVYGTSGGFTGHNGDQLTYVNDGGVIQSGGWEWGCSHSMAELVSYHPTLAKFMPICSSDCYASKGILINDSTVVYQCDGNCGGLVSAQFGQVALSSNGWKLAFNALDRPGITGKGIGFATIDGSLNASYVWLTNTDGANERDPILARLGNSLSTNRYVVGWMTANDNTYWLGVIDGNGAFLKGPEAVSSAGITWGNRDDSLRTRPDGAVSWVKGTPNGTALRLFRFNGAPFLP